MRRRHVATLWPAPVGGCCSWTATSSRATPSRRTRCSPTRCSCSTSSAPATGCAPPTDCGRSGTAGASSATRSPAPSPRSAATTAPAPSVGSPWTPPWSTPPRQPVRSSARARQVADLVGAGTADDPARGVVLTRGRVLGSLGHRRRRPHLDRRPPAGPAATEQRRGDLAMLFAYWTGLPDSDWCQIDVHEQLGADVRPVRGRRCTCCRSPGPPELTRGSAERAAGRRTSRRCTTSPPSSTRGCWSRRRQVSPVVAVPGDDDARASCRPAAGPGWALVGDAGLFKHPATAQGIGDALAQGWYVGQPLSRGDDLADYEAWRDAPGRRPLRVLVRRRQLPARPRPLPRLLRAWPPTRRPARSSWTSSPSGTGPRDVLTPDRMARWRAAWAYEQGLHEVASAARSGSTTRRWSGRPGLPRLDGRRPARPPRRRRRGLRSTAAFFADAMDAWRDPAVAAAREGWTAGHVDRHAQPTRDDLLRQAGAARQPAGGRAAARRPRRSPRRPTWMVSAPVADLAVHLADLARRSASARDRAAPVTQARLRRPTAHWLHQRLLRRALPALVLSDGHQDVAGRRGRTRRQRHRPRVRAVPDDHRPAQRRPNPALRLDGRPGAVPPVISPYPLPTSPAPPLDHLASPTRPTCPHHPPKGSTTMSTTISTLSPLAELKAKQQQIWSSGDYNKIAAITVPVAESLVDPAGVGPAPGSSTWLPAPDTPPWPPPAAPAVVTGIDYVPRLIEIAQRRAAAEDLAIDFRRGRRREPAVRRRLLRLRAVRHRRDVHRRPPAGRRRAAPGVPPRRTHRSGELDAHRLRRPAAEDRGPARPAAAGGPVRRPAGAPRRPCASSSVQRRRRDQSRRRVGDPTVRFAGGVRRPLPHLLRTHPHGGRRLTDEAAARCGTI